MSSAVRNIQKRKSNKVRKGLNSRGRKPGDEKVGSLVSQSKGSGMGKRRSKCQRCFGTGKLGKRDGAPLPCSCIPDKRFEEQAKKAAEGSGAGPG